MKYLKIYDTSHKHQSIFYCLDSILFVLVTECFIDHEGYPVLRLSDYRTGYERKPAIKVHLPNREDAYLFSRYTMLFTDTLDENAILISTLDEETLKNLESF